ncbi:MULTISPECIES: hypothetical protein [unclassified Streptomyces]|uniref:hypothetical protein n=1 Tax=unclassified Streptomyces TaxID=2593676 RepID=UPI002E150DDD|nr:hypothetical protein OG299_19495 [Streptomyces sp. NBC_01296]WSW60859.1 hypothetical protein OG513_21075 [Streptomyces sp. NBC_00998]
MSGTRQARTALARALSAACVVLLCLFASGPAVTTAAAAAAVVERTGSGAPSEPGAPVEGESDPAADPEVRPAVRLVVRGPAGVRQLPRPVFHVKHAGQAMRAESFGTDGPMPSAGTVRGVVLRC